MTINPRTCGDLWRAGCADEAHVRFGRRLGDTDRWKHRHRAPSRPHYSGRLLAYAHQILKVTIDIVRKREGQRTFEVLPRRWVVERTLSWLGRCRRLAHDYERLPEHSEAVVKWAMIGLMTRRLAPSPGRRPWQTASPS